MIGVLVVEGAVTGVLVVVAALLVAPDCRVEVAALFGMAPVDAAIADA